MIKIKKYLALLLFIGMDFNMKKNYWFLSVILFLNSCEDNIKNAESSGTKFSVTFHIGENDRVQDIEQTNDRGYIILVNNESNSPNHTGSYFLLKIDQDGIQEQILELDTTIYSGYTEVGQINDGSYIVRGFYQAEDAPYNWDNVLRIDSDFINQTQNSERILNGKFTSEGFTSLVGETSIIWNPFTVIRKYYLTKVFWTGDTLWSNDDLLPEIMAMDSNFSIYNGTYPSLIISDMTDDDGCILMGKNSGSLHLAKINSEGNVEWVKINSNGSYEEASVDGNTFLFDRIEQTMDGGYIIAGFNLMKLSSQGEFEWINENPIEVNDIIHTDFDVRQIKDGGYLLGGYYPNNDLENGTPYIIKTDNIGTVVSKIDFTDFLPPIRFETTDDGGYVFSASYDQANGDKDIVIIKFDSDGYMLELDN